MVNCELKWPAEPFWVWLVGWRWLKLKWDGRWTKKITRQWILSMGKMLWCLKFSKILLYLKLSEFVCVQNLFIKRDNPCRYGRYGCFICLQRSPGFDLTRGLHLLLACYIVIVDPAGLWSISANSNRFRHLDWWWAIKKKRNFWIVWPWTIRIIIQFTNGPSLWQFLAVMLRPATPGTVHRLMPKNLANVSGRNAHLVAWCCQR